MSAAADERFSVMELSVAYRRRRGQLSPEEVTEYFLERIGGLDGEVQAMVTVTSQMARAQARRAAERIADGDPSELLGVPIVLKDLIDVRGVPTTAGSAMLRDYVPTTSSAVWNRLKSAGAVLLGKANTHEFAYGGTTEPTRNPWNTGRLVGGSSGGPGAALAAGLCAAAVGTDTAGSIRIPANLCGVAGLKPTNGLVRASGVIPLAPSLDVVGPMAHHPRDLSSLLAVMCRDRAIGQGIAAAQQRIRRRMKGKRLRIGVLRNTGPLTPGVLSVQNAAAEFLGRYGVLGEVVIDDFASSVYTNFSILGVEAVQFHRRYAERRHLYTPYVRERLEQASETRAIDYLDALRAARTLRTTIDKLTASWDVLVLPGLPFAAPPIGATDVAVGGALEDRDTAMCRNTAFANVTGHPALAMPAGLDGGLPVGVQLVGRRHGDAELLAVGAALADEIAIQTIAPAFRTF